MSKFTQLSAFTKLQAHKTQMDQTNLIGLFADDADRANKMTVSACDIELDYSKNLVNEETLSLLVELAEQSNLQGQIDKMFGGEVINGSEKRSVLHTALRDFDKTTPEAKGVVADSLAKVESFVNSVHNAEFAGYTGKKLTTIVNIGIGGSYLGPKLISDALKPYWKEGFDIQYIANVDGTAVTEGMKGLDPETTLFVICSKSFGTLETLKNSEAAREWFLSTGAKQSDVKNHFVAVTTNQKAAVDFGIDAENLFPLWDWVGGRYSLWSTIGLPQAILLGMDTFKEVLKGAFDMDLHFKNTPIKENLPALLGLTGIWYNNFYDAQSQAILVYDDYLQELPNHLQQVDMESNGKSVTQDGDIVDYNTGPIIWGGAGTNGQHAYHQLLHQGTRLVPSDFIVPLKSHNPVADHHPWLYANAVGQAQAMLEGKNLEQVTAELVSKGMSEEDVAFIAPHKVHAGNRPSNMITFEQLTPKVLGSLIAMYEHKVMVQGAIWQINSFDQWGVELGKVLGVAVFDALQTGNVAKMDSSTANLVNKFRDA
ncbi:glucose-6-phosphate isomerase [Marinicellulosiphila megalodicopiae]|uniref:glucose-6-phosphate isomerase n=1 Tax=Marinicellulosiphila megalodicopiae TaxID=2724896 RepID=UPI003BB16511